MRVPTRRAHSWPLARPRRLEALAVLRDILAEGLVVPHREHQFGLRPSGRRTQRLAEGQEREQVLVVLPDERWGGRPQSELEVPPGAGSPGRGVHPRGLWVGLEDVPGELFVVLEVRRHAKHEKLRVEQRPRNRLPLSATPLPRYPHRPHPHRLQHAAVRVKHRGAPPWTFAGGRHDHEVTIRCAAQDHFDDRHA